MNHNPNSTHYGLALILNELLPSLDVLPPLLRPAVVGPTVQLHVLTRLLADSQLLLQSLGGSDDVDGLLQSLRHDRQLVAENFRGHTLERQRALTLTSFLPPNT